MKHLAGRKPGSSRCLELEKKTGHISLHLRQAATTSEQNRSLQHMCHLNGPQWVPSLTPPATPAPGWWLGQGWDFIHHFQCKHHTVPRRGAQTDRVGRLPPLSALHIHVEGWSKEGSSCFSFPVWCHVCMFRWRMQPNWTPQDCSETCFKHFIISHAQKFIWFYKMLMIFPTEITAPREGRGKWRAKFLNNCWEFCTHIQSTCTLLALKFSFFYHLIITNVLYMPFPFCHSFTILHQI